MKIIEGPEVRAKGNAQAHGFSDLSIPDASIGIHLDDQGDELHTILMKCGNSTGCQSGVITSYHSSNFSFTGKFAQYKNGKFVAIDPPYHTDKLTVARAVKI